MAQKYDKTNNSKQDEKQKKQKKQKKEVCLQVYVTNIISTEEGSNKEKTSH